MVMSISLPKLSSIGFPVIEPRILLRALDEGSAIGPLALAFDEQVKMIGHEAVRKYGQAFLVRGARNLPEYKFDRCGGSEHRRALMSAECQ